MRRTFVTPARPAVLESLESRAYFTVSFAAPLSLDGPGNAQGIASGDFNEDGRDDLAVTAFFDGAITLFLGNGDGSFDAQTPLTASANLSGVTMADVTGEGHQDLIAVGDSVTLFKGRGDGTFEDGVALSTGGSPQMAAASDLDGDADIDLAVPNTADESISVFINDGTGVFTKTTVASIGTPDWVSTADLDFDGDVDLVEANLGALDGSDGFGAGTVATFLNDGAGNFTLGSRYPAGLHPVGIDLADVNNDGNLDVVAANGGFGQSPRGSDDVSILLGNGDGTLNDAVNYSVGAQAPQGIKVFDFDEDGADDIVTANNLSGNISVLSGNGDGTFNAALNFASGAGNSQLALLDADNDGRTDVAATATADLKIAVLLNDAILVDNVPTVTAVDLDPPPDEGSGAFDFSVTYADDESLNIDTLGDDDIVVNGPSGALPVTLVSVDSSDPTSATATYRLAAPGGTFDAADSGVYNFDVAPGAVLDSAGQPVAPGQVGSISLDFAPRPDLSAAVVSALPTTALVGGAKGTASVRISNDGQTALTGAAFQVQLYLSTDTTFDGADLAIGAPLTSTLKLKPTFGKVVKFKFNYPNVADGIYHLLAQVDTTSAITEVHDDNNTAVTDATVDVAPAFIDLQVGPITSPSGTVAAGKRVTAAVLLTNIGNVPYSSSATMQIFASTDGVIDDADVNVATLTKVQKLKNGKGKPVKAKLDTSALPAGTYTLIARVIASGPLADGNPSNDIVVAGSSFTIG